jgi:hypothetical protein
MQIPVLRLLLSPGVSKREPPKSTVPLIRDAAVVLPEITRANKWTARRTGAAVVLLSGLLLSLVGGQGYMAGDGVSYLDVGDAFVGRQWKFVLNGYWSPLFPAFEGIARRMLGAFGLTEPAALALIKVLIYTLSLFCFQYFWSKLIDFYTGHSSIHSFDNCGSKLSEGWFWSLGYIVFLFSNLPLLFSPTPDLLLFAIVNLAEGIILAIYLGQRRWPSFLWLGVGLGVAFLTKAVLLPLSVTFGLAAALVPPLDRRVVFRGALVAAGFALVATPYIVVLSAAQGHLTYGSAGLLNYAFHGNQVPYVHWQGLPPGNGVPVHPTHQLFANPAVYGFAQPIAGTYPPWDNPTYWNEGIEPHLFAWGQATNLARNIVLIRSLLKPQIALVGAVILLLLIRGRFRETAREFLSMWFLWLPAFGAISLYATLFVEHRYIAPYWTLGWAAVFCLIQLPDGARSRRLLKAVIAICLTITGIQIARSNIRDAVEGRRDAELQNTIANGIQMFGTRPTERIAVMDGFLGEEWERLAHVSVVAEIPQGASFWTSDSARQSEICNLLAEYGVTTLVAESVPDSVSPVGWKRIERTSVYVRSLKKP